jgi:N-acetylmuramic acid 6-phosphate etherase
MSEPALFKELLTLSTEQRNPRTMEIDAVSTADALRLLHEEDKVAVASVESELSYIEKAVDIIVDAFRSGGRLLYVGAGTSGRLGVLDAAECPPTFGTDPDLVQGIIAGGSDAMFRAQEGSEDSEEAGADVMRSVGVTAQDVICGIAASRRTPFVVGAVQYARSIGAKTLFVTCNPRPTVAIDVDVSVCLDVGPEPIMGSTRMKSGTATKLVLNMMSTMAMVRLGKVYQNMMVDLMPSNKKLVERSRRVVMIASGVGYDEADLALKASGGHVKTALVMILGGVDATEARTRLRQANGFVRQAIF